MQIDFTQQITNDNTATLACAVALGSHALMEIAGNEIGNQIGGEDITLPFVQTALMARLKAAITPETIIAAGE